MLVAELVADGLSREDVARIVRPARPSTRGRRAPHGGSSGGGGGAGPAMAAAAPEGCHRGGSNVITAKYCGARRGGSAPAIA